MQPIAFAVCIVGREILWYNCVAIDLGKGRANQNTIQNIT